MPQMAPMSWTILFVSFILILILILTINYFNFLKNPSNQSTSYITILKSSLNWKW